jgi:outer membrane protein TolC
MIKYSLSFLLIFNCIFLLAQPLDELVELAIQNNPDLRSLEKSYQAQLMMAPQVDQLPDPELSVGWFPLPVETRLGAQNLRVGFTQNFPWKGTIAARKAVENGKAELVKSQKARQQLQLIIELEQAYFTLFAFRTQAIQLDSSRQLLLSLKELTLAKVAAGMASNADVLRVQLKINEVEQRVRTLEIETITPRAVINRILSRESDREVLTPADLGFVLLPYRKDSVLAKAKSSHPDIKWLSVQQDLAGRRLIVNELSRKPVFGLGADYIQVGKRTDLEPKNNGRDIILLRGGVKIPINGKRFDAKAQEEELRIAALAEQKEGLEDNYAMVIEQGFAHYQQAALDYQFYNKQKAVLNSTINLMISNYSSKGGSLEELLLLYNDLVIYDFKIINALVQSYLAKSQLDQFLY